MHGLHGSVVLNSTLTRNFPCREAYSRPSHSGNYMLIACPSDIQLCPKHVEKHRRNMVVRASQGKRPSKQPGISTKSDKIDHSTWRMFNIAVDAEIDPGKDDFSVNEALVKAVKKRLGSELKKQKPEVTQKGYSLADAITIVRKSFDSRKKFHKVWRYVVDIDTRNLSKLGLRKLKKIPGQFQPLDDILRDEIPPKKHSQHVEKKLEPIVVVGAGPAGLFAALEVAEAGLPVVLLERGQPVEVRGKDIGSLVVRKKLKTESNYCYGEGGAGTWSDGKLTTRIGRNDDPVRKVLNILCSLGAPENILVYGKPHLGTDRLILILKNFRERLRSAGVDIRFGTLADDILVENGRVHGVVLSDGSKLTARKVILATGHSAREILPKLLEKGVALTPKPFAMGFRIEHPQTLIDQIQYGKEDADTKVLRGKGQIPVADYRLSSTIISTGKTNLDGKTSEAVVESRGAYSFCMCPGGIIVTTSTNPNELSINGMSFSKRNSKWANSALVVTCSEKDWSHHLPTYGPLAGVQLQRDIEVEAAKRGGGRFVAPAQRVVDFLDQKKSIQEHLPPTSYRLGTRAAMLHDLYSEEMSLAFIDALEHFEKQMPGFASSPEALLLAPETRTSAAVRIDRGSETESPTLRDLHPCGEGAGYAGGIVSAAVDGMRVGKYVVADLTGIDVSLDNFPSISESY